MSENCICTVLVKEGEGHIDLQFSSSNTGVGDEVKFVSPHGSWRIAFIDSPFSIAPQSELVIGAKDVPLVRVIRREGNFPFTCELTVNGRAVKRWKMSPVGDPTIGGAEVPVPRPPRP